MTINLAFLLQAAHKTAVSCPKYVNFIVSCSGNANKFIFGLMTSHKSCDMICSPVLSAMDQLHWCSQARASLAASPSPPGRSRAHARQSRAEGGEGLANFAVD